MIVTTSQDRRSDTVKTIKEFVFETFQNNSVFVQNAIKDLEGVLDEIARVGVEHMDAPMEEVVSYKINTLLKEYVLNNEQECEEVLNELNSLLSKGKLDEANNHFKNDTVKKVRYLYKELLYVFFCEYQHYVVELQSEAGNMFKANHKVRVCEPEEIILNSYKKELNSKGDFMDKVNLTFQPDVTAGVRFGGTCTIDECFEEIREGCEYYKADLRYAEFMVCNEDDKPMFSISGWGRYQIKPGYEYLEPRILEIVNEYLAENLKNE